MQALMHLLSSPGKEAIMIEETTGITVPKKRRADKESKSRKKQKQTMEEDKVVEEPEIREITIPTPEYVTLEFSSEEEIQI